MRKTLYKYLVYMPEEKNLAAKIMNARLGVFAGVMFLWLCMQWALDPAPPLSEIARFEGYLAEVDVGTRTRHVVTVKNQNEAIQGVVTGRAFGEEIERFVGLPVTIWHYSLPQFPFPSEIQIVEISVEGRTLKNDWEEVRQRLMDKPTKPLLMLGLFCVSVFPLRIRALLNQK